MCVTKDAFLKVTLNQKRNKTPLNRARRPKSPVLKPGRILHFDRTAQQHGVYFAHHTIPMTPSGARLLENIKSSRVGFSLTVGVKMVQKE